MATSNFMIKTEVYERFNVLHCFKDLQQLAPEFDFAIDQDKKSISQVIADLEHQKRNFNRENLNVRDLIPRIHKRNLKYEPMLNVREEIINPYCSECRDTRNTCRLIGCPECSVSIQVNTNLNILTYRHISDCVGASCHNSRITRHWLFGHRLSHKGNLYEIEGKFHIARSNWIDSAAIAHVDPKQDKVYVFRSGVYPVVSSFKFSKSFYKEYGDEVDMMFENFNRQDFIPPFDTQ
ncbi:hypothetical protein [Melon chlorotic spot virus]|uniref:Uncharacterized protein n=1 Tax=Melon chlorotic spot virus TaxID=2479459 RepID=A0A3G1Z1G8_9VIRU|nr:hypothetical protein [Melon chlorotic spot virus]AYL40770.1 hypothetical protein [Melon chlorotic spot virus]